MGNQIVSGGGCSVSFDYPVKEVLELDDIAVVVLDVPPKAVMTENVFGVNCVCRIVWQIERIAATSSDPTNIYVGVSRLGDNQTVAIVVNWNGTAVYVDTATGRVVETVITK